MAKKTYQCFIISAFGNKPLLRREINPSNVQNFDPLLYEIRELIRGYADKRDDIEIEVKRSDELSSAVITNEFYEWLFHSDLVVAEISAVSANVYYELGVRFALRPGATLLLAIEGVELPFDLQSIRVTYYEPGKLKNKRDEIYTLLESRLEKMQSDSPVYEALPDLQILSRKEILDREAYLDQTAQAYKARINELEKEVEALRFQEKTLALLADAQEYTRVESPTKENLRKATNLLKQAYELSPDSYRVAFQYGRMLNSTSQYNEAIIVLERAVELNQRDANPLAEPYRELGLAYRWRGTKNKNRDDLRTAQKYFRMALELNNNDDHTWGLLGGLYKREDDIKEAIECYQAGMDVNEQSTYCLVNELMLRTMWKELEFEENKHQNIVRLQALNQRADYLLGDVDVDSNAYWRVINRAEVLILRGETKEALALYHHAADIATTPNELKSALDNLTYMMERMPQLDGVKVARKHLYETRQRIQIVE